MIVLPVLALFAASVLARPNKLLGELSVKVWGPANSVSSLDSLTFTALVKNTGGKDLKILTANTVLDEGPTRSFSVVKNGTEVPFMGIEACFASNKLNDSAFTVIAAGETIRVSHVLGSLYDFVSAGPGNFSFTPLAHFQAAGAEEEVHSVAQLSMLQTKVDVIDVSIDATAISQSLWPAAQLTAANHTVGAPLGLLHIRAVFFNQRVLGAQAQLQSLVRPVSGSGTQRSIGPFVSGSVSYVLASHNIPAGAQINFGARISGIPVSWDRTYYIVNPAATSSVLDITLTGNAQNPVLNVRPRARALFEA
ncbi:hypothetical protein Hypma_002516 [Hypsizygus marmoreus]|uniref:Uncharacterized protein n=1 Tax=Hypsizygus marmoreus TaxID=39966 RepID=A0A369JB69_HYPMA|nr:hypothetical protein Hypma_002516 [Hypsizygus marmoreus]